MKAYLDHAATTPVHPQVFQAMKPYFTHKFGNPSSVHSWGQEAREALDRARERVAGFLGAKPGEIIFTSCATESINLAHKGLIEAVSRQPSAFRHTKLHIVTSSMEHKAVLETCKHLEKLTLAEVSYLPVDKFGMIKLADVKKAIKPNTVLISIMSVSNEVGTIQPIQEIGDLVKEINCSRLKSQISPLFFHTDATQAIQYLHSQVNHLGVDLLSLTGHKLHAPKGVGALYVREGVRLVRQLDGGGQENQIRAGTENIAYVVGLAKAIELTTRRRAQSVERIEKLRDKLIDGVLKIPGAKLTGHPKIRAPHIASFTIKGVEGEAVLLLLDEKGIAASSGSACTSGSLKPSHVLTSMGIPPEIAHGSLRFSLSKQTTEEEIDYVLAVLPKVIAKLRKIAPKL